MNPFKTFRNISLLFILAINLAACSGGGGGGGGDNGNTGGNTPPKSAATVNLTFPAIKTFRFTWTDVSDASFYRLLENADGSSGFSQIGGDIVSTTQIFDHVVPLHARVNAQYILQSCNAEGCTDSATTSLADTLVDSIGYFKASNSDMNDRFGSAVSLSADGNTLAVGAPRESSDSIGVGSTPNENALNAGAVYVFSRTASTWTEQAYIKASNSDEGDEFGFAVSLSADGNTLAVGAYLEDSDSIGVGSTPNENTSSAGAVYVFSRTASTWSEQAYIKASNSDGGDQFGFAVSLSADGNTLAVGARLEDSDTTGTGSTPNENVINAGAVYVFSRTASTWSEQAYIKASNSDGLDQFGFAVSLNADGNTLAVGAHLEDSDSIGVGSTPNENASSAGAVYVFSRTASTWSEQAYIKASNSDGGDQFGFAVSLSADGNTLAVGAYLEDSDSIGVGSTPNENTSSAGAVYVFSRTASTWSEQAYIKASNSDGFDQFGLAVSLSADGNTLVVGAPSENSDSIGVGSTPNESATNAGAAYVFSRTASTWAEQAYIKASDINTNDFFGLAVSLSADGNTLTIGAHQEDGNGTGVGPTTNENAASAGAVYLY